MQRHNITLNRVIDGDTVDVDIHLGFDITLSNQRIRLIGIDTPEIHSSDQEEKYYGNLAKDAVINWIERLKSESKSKSKSNTNSNSNLQLVYNQDDYRDKFGRILADLSPVIPSSSHLDDSETETLCQFLVKNHHAVPYQGQNKDQIRKQHIENRAYFAL